MAEPGKLYLVPTPIGNLDDITLRALKTLTDVDLVACEDTRRSGQLLAHFEISKKKISYFEHNEFKRVPQIVARLLDGQDVAVISDGGSPGLSDPAYRLVVAAIGESIEVIPLPGANAVIPALTASGLPSDRFFFEGFLPVKSGARKTRLRKLEDYPHTLIFYESVHRIRKALNDIAEVFGERQVCVARELSKLHEEFIRGTAEEIAADTNAFTIKGEFVIIVAGHKK